MIQPKYVTLANLFVDRVFEIPSYQRFYSWEKKQRADLFEDIKVLSKTAEGHHFMATIVCHFTRVTNVGAMEYKVVEVVDGQQRITTLIMLLKAIATRLPEGPDQKDVEELLVKRDGNLLLLQTNNSNQNLFNNYLRTGTIPAKSTAQTQADRCLLDGLGDCAAFVDSWQADGGDLLTLLRLIRNRLGCVVYDTEDKRAVYTIFEVLNSRGLDVDWLEKCKSMLMGRAYENAASPSAASSAINELEAAWGNVYRRLAQYPVAGHEVLRVTASTRCINDAGKPLSAELSLDALKQLCTAPGKAQEVTQWIFDTADALVDLEEQTHLGPVADVLQSRVLAVSLKLAQQLNEKQRTVCLDQWERVTFRIFGLGRRDARTKLGEYIRLARRILRKEKGAQKYSEILSALKNLGENFTIEKAVESLAGSNSYENFEAECRYILWRYEEGLAKAAGAAVNEEARAEIWNARSAADTIEHIFPQNADLNGAWKGKLAPGLDLRKQTNRIGNLLLMPKALNSEASRKSFKEKKVTLSKTQSLRMVKEVTDKRDWTDKQIAEREAKIINWARTAWCDVQ